MLPGSGVSEDPGGSIHTGACPEQDTFAVVQMGGHEGEFHCISE